MLGGRAHVTEFQDCTGLGEERVGFPHSSSSGAVFWISAVKSIDKGMFSLLWSCAL